MWGTPWSLLAVVAIAGGFTTIQNNHALHFHGSSKGFGAFLGIFSFASIIALFSLIVYWWWGHGLLSALSLLLAVLAGSAIASVIVRAVGLLFVSMGGFVAIPICAAVIIGMLRGVSLRPYLEEVIAYVEQIAGTNFDMYFSKNVTVTCGACGQTIIRNLKLLDEGTIVECQNPQCIASYIVHVKNDEFVFETNTLEVRCRKCQELSSYDANVFRSMKTDGETKRFKCEKCGTPHLIKWALYYRTEEEVKHE